MNNYNWTLFKATVYVRASVPQIYVAWSTAQGIKQWFPKKATYFSPDGNARKANEMAEAGDNFEWEWIGGHTLKGQVLECEQDKSFKFTFGSPVTVSVNLEEDEGSTRITVLQENIPNTEEGRLNQHLKCRLSWTFYLNNLKAFVELHGDLRDWNVLHLQHHLDDGIVSY